MSKMKDKLELSTKIFEAISSLINIFLDSKRAKNRKKRVLSFKLVVTKMGKIEPFF